MDSQQIIAALDNEIARLQNAGTLIAQSASGEGPGRSHVGASATKPKTRMLSAAARERIAAAQRKSRRHTLSGGIVLSQYHHLTL
jgi:hypothetical protein